MTYLPTTRHYYSCSIIAYTLVLFVCHPTPRLFYERVSFEPCMFPAWLKHHSCSGTLSCISSSKAHDAFKYYCHESCGVEYCCICSELCITLCFYNLIPGTRHFLLHNERSLKVTHPTSPWMYEYAPTPRKAPLVCLCLKSSREASDEFKMKAGGTAGL